MTTHVPGPAPKRLAQTRRHSSTPRRSRGRSPASPTRSSSGTPSSSRVALVGIQTRGVPARLAARRLVAERSGSSSPLGTLDITLPPRRRAVATAERRRTAAGRARDEHPVPARGHDRRARRRRALHGPHDPRRDRRAPRVRPPGARPARRARRPRPPRAPDPARLRRQEPPDRTRRADPGRARRGRRGSIASCSSPSPRTAAMPELARTAPALDRRPRARRTSSACSTTARSLAASLDREMTKLPTLRGRTVVNLFYESSTRTLASFELAAKRLSADTMSLPRGRLLGRTRASR